MKSPLNESSKLALAVVVAATILASAGQAQCGFSTGPKRVATAKAASPILMAQTLPMLHNAEPMDSHGSSNRSIVGLWRVTFVSGGQVVDEGFDIWSSDGTEILNDTPPPATGNVCLGVWIQTGKSSYKLKHPSWNFDPAGNVTGTSIMRVQPVLDPKGNSFTGPVTVDVFDLNGNLLFHEEGTVTGERITVD